MTLHHLDAGQAPPGHRHAVIRPRTSVENAERPPGWRPLRIAMIGQKGMPATYGGIERHVEEMSSRLVALGHEVTVYCRHSYDAMPMDQYRGVRLRRTRTVASKHLDAIVHSATATLAALKDRPDVLHYHGIGPALVTPVPRYLSRVPVVQTIHGLDNRRAKWNRAARAALGAAHWLSGYVPDVRIAHGSRPVFVVAGTATSHRVRGTGRSWSLITADCGAVVVRERFLGPGGWHTGRVLTFPADQ